VVAVRVDHEKVKRMVTATLRSFDDSGAHPGEIILALGESIGRVIAATHDMGLNEIGQRELLDVAIKQMTNAILVGRAEKIPIVMQQPGLEQ